MNQSKSNFNQAFWLSVSNASAMIVSILSSVILSRVFDKAEYGTYKQIIFVYNTLLVVFQAGLPAVFTYFLPQYSREEGKYIVKKIQRLLFFLGAAFSLTIFFGADYIARLLNNAELAKGLKIFSVFPMFTLPTMGVEGIYTVNRNTRFVAVYNIATRLLMLLCIVLPVVFIRNSYVTALYGWGIASFVTFIIAVWAKNIPYKDVDMLVVPRATREIFQYSLPITGAALLMIVFNSVNQFFISRYFGAEEFADFSNGYISLPFVPIIIAPIRALLRPAFAKASVEKHYGEALGMLCKGMRQVSILIIPLTVFSFAFADDIVMFLYGQAYVTASTYFRLFLVFNFFEIFVFSGVVSAIGKPMVDFWFELICTILVWLIDFILVMAGIMNVYAIVAVFTFCNILMRYLLPYVYLTRREKMKVLDKGTLLLITKSLLHVGIVGVAVSLFSVHVEGSFPVIIRLCINIILFYFMIGITGRIVRVNYFQALLRFVKK